MSRRIAFTEHCFLLPPGSSRICSIPWKISWALALPPPDCVLSILYGSGAHLIPVKEEGDRKAGSGLDSSVESRGTEEVCRIRHGGIDRMVDCRNRLEGCRVDSEGETLKESAD